MLPLVPNLRPCKIMKSWSVLNTILNEVFDSPDGQYVLLKSQSEHTLNHPATHIVKLYSIPSEE